MSRRQELAKFLVKMKHEDMLKAGYLFVGTEKIPRNAMCPCAPWLGVKFKHCHGPLVERVNGRNYVRP